MERNLESPKKNWKTSIRWQVKWKRTILFTFTFLLKHQLHAGREAIVLRNAEETKDFPILISGNVGPRGDGYVSTTSMTPQQAEEYHSFQINAFAAAGADLVGAFTLTYSDEAVGICSAAGKADMPVAIAFTVETDGKLPSGETLKEAIEAVEKSDKPPIYYMINCAHFDHFMPTIREGRVTGEDWVKRIKGARANPSRLSHEELDGCTELQPGDTLEYGKLSGQMKKVMPWAMVFGGCCGTNEKHVEQIGITLQSLRN